ncbi:DUF4142 domain-containing protein [Sphingomonas sp. SRS2]|uniref:DUF4142 domain-containing protein n=1 Tax=Sphingomonas sp. SRS2 TaxID=133190 RepID=UPI0006985245|nr:DUF4142 domain-containing protein [Sphingomonas sp. SRS2]
MAAAAFAQSPRTTATDYIASAGASDLYEKTSSELVLKDAGNEGVRDFANMMIRDHSNTTQQVKTAATSAGLQVPPPKLMPKHKAMIDKLEKSSGAAREKLYIQQQLVAHQEALALHSGYAKGGDTPALKQVAAGAVPVIQQHLDLVKRLHSGAK